MKNVFVDCCVLSRLCQFAVYEVMICSVEVFVELSCLKIVYFVVSEIRCVDLL